MNLIIDDTDHPLIIKVASIQSARMQIYFIDNDDYFGRKFIFTDTNGEEFTDNDERSIFFNRGVIETIIKLNWSPDIIHCHGWFTALMPMYIKKSFGDNPLFADSKIVYSAYNDCFNKPLNKKFKEKIKFNGIQSNDTKILAEPNYLNINKIAINYADAVIAGDNEVNKEIKEYVQKTNLPFLDFVENDYIDKYSHFYEELLK
jgi:starch synthase